MYQALLSVIIEKARSIRWPVQPPATAAEIERLVSRSEQELGVRPPNEYPALLQTVNGLEWNGLVVYATRRTRLVNDPRKVIEGFVEGNLNYRDFEPLRQYLIFADDGSALYVENLNTEKYEVILRVGMTVLRSLDSFSSLMLDALRAAWPFALPESIK
jgi:hypothetical protein